MRPSWMIAAFVCALAAAPGVAPAQEADYAVVAPPSNSTDEAAPPDETPLTPDEAATLGNALVFDSTNLADGVPAKSLKLPSLTDSGKFDINHTSKSDGSSAMVLKQPYVADDWDAKIGADLNLAGTPPAYAQPNRPLPLVAASQDTGAAWASVGVSNLASVDARVDPTSDQGKLGTTFKQAFPVGSTVSMTLQNTFSVTQSFMPAATAPADIPLMAAPVAGPPAPQIWGSEKAVKFDVLATGTTFGAGIATASNDPVTHNKFSADQKLYGPLHVTTALTDVGQASAGRSISAALKLNW